MESKRHQQNEIVTAVNIGSSKVCAVIGKMNIIGKLEVLGYGKASCDGVIRGVVSNIDKTAKALNDAIDLAEKMAKFEVSSVYVGIGGHHIKSIHHQGVFYRESPNSEITSDEVSKIINEMHKIALPPGDQIIQIIPQEFFVDDQDPVLDPVGMSGSRLESNFHIITGNTVASNNIVRALEKAGLELSGIILEPLSTAQAVLSHEEKEAGVVLVDLGGGTTHVSVFHEGVMRFTSVIPVGSNVISKDIKVGCSVLLEQAEKLKVRFGSALSDEVVDNRIITIPGLMGRDPKEISEKNLARIIQARVEEIFDHVMWDIRRSGYEKQLYAGIVLTGGGSKLKNIELLAEYQTGLAARIGAPTQNLASHYEDELAHPMYASAIGLLQEGLLRMAPAPAQEVKSDFSHVFDLHDDQAATTGETPLETVDYQGFKETVPGQMARKNWIAETVNRGIRGVRQFFEPSEDADF